MPKKLPDHSERCPQQIGIPLCNCMIDISEATAIQLYECLKRSYISHEDYPLVHLLMKHIADKYSDVIPR